MDRDELPQGTLIEQDVAKAFIPGPKRLTLPVVPALVRSVKLAGETTHQKPELVLFKIVFLVILWSITDTYLNNEVGVAP